MRSPRPGCHRSVPGDLVALGPARVVSASIEVLEDEAEMRVFDPELLGQFPASSRLVALPTAHHAPKAGVIHAGKHVLVSRASVDVNGVVGVATHNRGAAMQQLSRSDLRASRVADHVVVLVHDVHDLRSWVHQPRALRSSGRTNHRSEKSATLPKVDTCLLYT